MSEKAPKRYSDGSLSFEGGVDSGVLPYLVEQNQVAFAVNCTFRGGQISPRPGWSKKTFVTSGGSNITSVFQCAYAYIADSGDFHIILMAGGRVYRWDPTTETTLELTSNTLKNASNIQNGWMEQAENFLIIQDGQSRPLIYDGAKLRRANVDEIKTGTVMRYVNGRIWYALPSGFEFRATDLVYADGSRASVLKETESDFLIGGNFSVPSDGGPITAMAVPCNLDTSLGQGPLLVFTPKYVFSVQAPLDREAWASVNYPIQAVSQNSNGALGARSTITVNGDVFYRAADGIRSFVIARRDFGSWGNTPVSGEMARTLENETDVLLRWGSAIVFDNRLLMTSQPVYRNKGTVHKSITVLDFELISNMKKKLPPSWEGIWTGLDILQLVKAGTVNGDSAYIISRAANDAIQIWEITTDAIEDEVSSTSATPIQWEWQTRAFNFGTPFGQKRLDYGEIWIGDLRKSVTFWAGYRPDQYPGWVPWNCWTECATVDNCGVQGCLPIQLGQPQYRYKLRLPTVRPDCSEVLGTQYRLLYEAQMRVKVSGWCRIKGVRVHAYDEPESVTGKFNTDSECSKLVVCEPDPLGYDSTAGTFAAPAFCSENGGNGCLPYSDAVPGDGSGSSPTSYTLAISRVGTGSGSVQSSVPGINCGSDCLEAFAPGTVVTLTATPDTGSVFTGWQGGGCTGTGSCTVTMDQSRNVTAQFTSNQQPTTYELTIETLGPTSGRVESADGIVNCGIAVTCTYSYPAGSVVTLNGIPESNSLFAGWGGDICSGTNSCTFTMNGPKFVTALFAADPPIVNEYALNITKSGSGSGTVTSNVGGINCGGTCNAILNDGTVVTLTATPSFGSVFAGWSGSGCSGTGTCQVTMNDNKNVNATFNSVFPTWGEVPVQPPVCDGYAGSMLFCSEYAWSCTPDTDPNTILSWDQIQCHMATLMTEFALQFPSYTPTVLEFAWEFSSGNFKSMYFKHASGSCDAGSGTGDLNTSFGSCAVLCAKICYN